MEVTYDALKKRLAQAQEQIAVKDQRIAELEYLLMLIKNVKSGPFYFDGQEYQITFYQN